MTPSAGQPGTRTDAGRGAPDPRARRRLDRTVVWSMGLYLISFPLMLVWLVVLSAAATFVGVDLQGDPTPGEQRTANLVYMALVLSTLVPAAAVGIRGWVRRRQAVALLVAILSVLTAVAFVLFPLLAGG